MDWQEIIDNAVEQIAKRQARKDWSDYLAQWLPYAVTGITSLHLLFDAMGYEPDRLGKWLTWFLFTVTFVTLTKPAKSVRQRLLRSMKPKH